MNTAKIEKEIKDYKTLLASGAVKDADEKAFINGQISILGKKLKKTGKKSSKPAAEKKETVKKKSKPRIPADKMPNCDELISKWEARHEAAKKARGRHKTKPVFESIGEKVEAAVIKAAKSTDKKDVKKNPGEYIAKLEKLETSAKHFLTSFKEILGDDYDSSETQTVLKGIEKIIADVKKKYKKD